MPVEDPPSRPTGHTVRFLPLLGLLVTAAALLALVTCLDALVLHEVPVGVGCFAFVGATIGTAGLVRGVVRALELLRAARAARGGTRGAAALPGHPGVLVLPSARCAALCAGLLRPRVLVTSGAVESLSPAALAVVIAHERHHARRRDGLRNASAEVLAASLFLRPAGSRVREAYRTLLELEADRAAAPEASDRRGLAAAMLAFDRAGHAVDPARVDRLLGRGGPLELPRRTLLAAVALLATLATTATTCTVATGCLDIFVLREDDATAARVGLLPVLALAAMSLLAVLAREDGVHLPTRRLESA